MILGVFCTSFCKDLYSLIFCYGVLFGCGIGFAVSVKQYPATLIVAWSNFPQHKGRATGIIVAAFGFGASIFNVVATAIVNPHNANPNVKVKNGSVTNHFFKQSIAKEVPSMLRWLALIYLIITVVGICLVALAKPTHSSSNNTSESVKPHLKSKTFWLLIFVCYCSSAVGTYAAADYKGFGDQVIDDDEFMAIVGSIASIANGTSRYVWAQVMEWTSFRTTYLIVLVLQTVLIATLYYIGFIKALFLIWIALIMACEGGHNSLFAAIYSIVYGTAMGARLYGFFFLNVGLSAITSFFIQLVAVRTLGYQGMFWILACLSTVSIVVMLFFNPEKDAQNVKDEATLKEGSSMMTVQDSEPLKKDLLES